jgi:beta-lactamase regulating signal transducer with metallopeptidase domain
MNRTVIDALGWTLVHFLWQGALIAATLCVVDLILARSRATLRYAAACVAFTLMLLAPMATFFVLRGQLATASSQARALVAAPRSAEAELAPVAPEHRAAPARQLRPFSASRTPFARLASAQINFSRLLPWVVEVWVLGVVIVSLRLIGGWWLVRRLARASGNVSLEAWQARLRDLAERMSVSRPVRLCRSALVEVPTVVGWMKPVILLPATTLTGLAPGQIEAILAHELAHIRRHDYLVNLLQSVVEMLLFYHPAVWWVSKRIRDERELCCDELAIRVSGDAVSYARALYELECLRGRAVELALAASGGSLARRIARLLGLPGRPWEAATRGLVGFVGASAVIAILVLGTLQQSAAIAQVSTKIVRTTAQVAKVEVARAVVAIEQRAVKVAAAVPVLTKNAKCDLAAAAENAQMDAAMAEAAARTRQDCQVRTAVTTEPSTETSTDVSVTVGEPGTTVDVQVACNKDKNQDQDDDEDGASATKRFTADEWQRMRQHGVSEKYVENLHPYLPDLTSDELVTLADHGVSSIYVANLKRAGLDELSVDDLVRLASHGVQSQYVANVRNAGLDQVSVEDMVRLADHGVSSAYIRGLKGIDPNDLRSSS